MLKPAGANSVGALFVFLDLLKGQAQGVAQFFLAHAKHYPPHTDAAANVPVDRVRYFFHEFRSNHHGSAASLEDRDAGTSIWRRILIAQMRPAAYRRAAFFQGAGVMTISKHGDKPLRGAGTSRKLAQSLSGMEESWHLQLFGEDPLSCRPAFRASGSASSSRK